MARKLAIDVNAGTGRRWRRLAIAPWLLAGLCLVALTLSGRVPAPWLIVGWLLLLAGPFARRHGTGVPKRMRLYRDGSLVVPGPAGGGRWSARAWTTRWLSVVPVEVGGRRRLVVAAWRNDPDDYRVLQTWLRHPPASEDACSPDADPR